MVAEKAVDNRKNEDRKIYLDCLRILATLAVMMLHVTAQNWHSVAVTTPEWAVFNLYNGLSRWALPIFVMISGALFLSREPDIKRIYSKNIFRILSAFVFWSALYAALGFAGGKSMTQAAIALVKGHYHMWFLPMIVGVYIIIPLLKPIARQRVLVRYFIGVSFLFSFAIPQIAGLLSLMDGKYLNLFNTLVDNVGFHFTLGFSAYFIIGYYVDQIDIVSDRRKRHRFYGLGLLGLVVSIGGNYWLCITIHKAIGRFYHYFTLNILCVAVGFFVFMKYRLSKGLQNATLLRWIKRLSTYSFGAYLVHAMVIEQIKSLFGLHTLSFHPALSCLLLWLLVAVISYLISAIVNALPRINRYIA